MEVEENIYVEGHSQAFGRAGFLDVKALKEVFRAIEDKHLMLKLFNLIETMEKGVTVLIGSENPVGEMQECSMVVSPYLKEGRVIGTIGVIGPVRMRYPKVISLVERTAKLLTKVFSNT